MVEVLGALFKASHTVETDSKSSPPPVPEPTIPTDEHRYGRRMTGTSLPFVIAAAASLALAACSDSDATESAVTAVASAT